MSTPETLEAKSPRSDWSYWTIRLAIPGAVIGFVLGVALGDGILERIFVGLVVALPCASVLGGFGAMIDAPQGAVRGGTVGLALGLTLFGLQLWLMPATPPRQEQFWQILAGLAGSMTFTGAMIGSVCQLCAVRITANERWRRFALGGLFGSAFIGLMFAMGALFFVVLQGVGYLIDADWVGPVEVWRWVFVSGFFVLINGITWGWIAALGVKVPIRQRQFRLSKSKWVNGVVTIASYAALGALWGAIIYGWRAWIAGGLAGIIVAVVIWLLNGPLTRFNEALIRFSPFCEEAPST